MKLARSAINWHQESRLSLKSFSTPVQSYLALSIFGTLWQSLLCCPIAPRSAGVERPGRQLRAVRPCGVGGCGEPARAARPAPRCRETPSGAGVAQPEVGKLTLPAHSDKSGGSLHRRAEVADMGQQKYCLLSRSCHSLPEGRAEKPGLWLAGNHVAFVIVGRTKANLNTDLWRIRSGEA